MIIKTAMGEDPRAVFNNRPENVTANASRFITSDKNGTLKQLINNNAPSADIAMMDIFVNPGDEIRKFDLINTPGPMADYYRTHYPESWESAQKE